MRRSRVKTTTSRSFDGAESYSRALGVVETPRAVVTMMVNLALDNVSSHLSVLEPACGICPFLTALREARGPNSDHDRYVGVEVRSEVVKACASTLKGFSVVGTDILFGSGGSLQNAGVYWRLCGVEGAEGVAEGVRDFADGSACTNRVNDGGHQVG